MLMSAGIFEFSRAFWYYNALDKATRDATRYMSEIPFTDYINTTNYNADLAIAKAIAVKTATDAGVPGVVAGNFSVSWNCAPPCGGNHPAWVSTAISGFSLTLGSTMPFAGVAGGTFGSVTLQPSTTIRYMN
jgi:hypothetical protein